MGLLGLYTVVLWNNGLEHKMGKRNISLSSIKYLCWLVLFSEAVGNWMPLSKVMLYVFLSSHPFQEKECDSATRATVFLSLINATAPACSSLTARQLCFTEMDLSFHIKENKPPGTFHQLQLPSVHHLCQNLSISYKLLAGKTGTEPLAYQQ